MCGLRAAVRRIDVLRRPHDHRALFCGRDAVCVLVYIKSVARAADSHSNVILSTRRLRHDRPRQAHTVTHVPRMPHAAISHATTANDACLNMVTRAEPSRRSALTGTACRRVLLDSSGEDHGLVKSCVDGHVDVEPHRVRRSTGEARRRKPAQKASRVALTRSRTGRRGRGRF